MLRKLSPLRAGEELMAGEPTEKEKISTVLKSKDTETVFPWSLMDEVFDALEERQARTLRYCDLETADSWCGSRLRYLDEYIQFRSGRKTPAAFIEGLFSYAAIRWGDQLPHLNRLVVSRADRHSPPTVILQHDADLLPEKTCEMMRIEDQRGLRSSCYFFVQHATEENYHLDTAVLQAFEQRGFEIGYHQNAFERAHYNKAEAYRLVDQDVAWLKKYFNIRSFVPHGGEPASDGRNNEHLAKKHALWPLLWAYNGKCILKDYTWSDGGIRKRSPIDPRVFVRKLVRGSRAMMLMHPQYYGSVLRDDWESLPIAKEKWWRELWGM
jgi:hypothetical protein